MKQQGAIQSPGVSAGEETKMPKKRKAGKRASKEQRQLLASALAEECGIPATRAQAIVKRYGPSQERCAAAAAAYIRIRSLLD
jgi:hypothetical protein